MIYISIIEIYTGKSLLDLEGPWLTRLRVDMTPIVKTESHITVLLNLKDNNAGAQRMNRSRRDEYSVTLGRNDAVEVVYDSAVGEGLPHVGDSCARPQAGIDAAVFLCLNYNPGFGLTQLPRWKKFRVRIAGMHLHGKHFACVKKLE